MATNRETLLQLRETYTKRIAELTATFQPPRITNRRRQTPDAGIGMIAGLTEAVRLLDMQLDAIPELIYEPSGDMDSGAAG